MEKTKVFLHFDLDGVVFKFMHGTPFSEVLKKGYFLNLPLQENIHEAVRILIRENMSVVIRSAVLSDMAREEKDMALDIHLPELTKENRIYTKCGKSKVDFDITKHHILIDDFTPNLMDWEKKGGTAVKCRTPFNGTKGRWEGKASVFSEDSPEKIVTDLLKIIAEI